VERFLPGHDSVKNFDVELIGKLERFRVNLVEIEVSFSKKLENTQISLNTSFR